METLTTALIAAAVMAGRYRDDARRNPERAAGWERMADRWSVVASGLAGDLVEAARCQTLGGPAAPFPGHKA
ncbi:hypothetical protein [Phenylobacterium sp. 58.2.17]|uniref:hypothetical protein n=1 Tax=Phenylobacterium sp. 58.2.17 TaxID=2969306 RepID=UPI0022651C07|nr:hypothetical protein [Phenylobacterium sp. 58.2.17]MCX7585042.1 hypothetical protein [Phenylobacterium sp. 58.2.17]